MSAPRKVIRVTAPRAKVNRNADLVWNCHECAKPIADGKGWVTINYGDLNRYDRDVAAWEAEHNTGDTFQVYSLGVFLTYPAGPRWHVWHKACDPDIESSDYCIDVERIRTVADLLHWTSHLLEKNWLPNTDWDAILEGQSQQLGRGA